MPNLWLPSKLQSSTTVLLVPNVHCLVYSHTCISSLCRAVLGIVVGEIRTRDLSITSPMLCHWTTEQLAATSCNQYFYHLYYSSVTNTWWCLRVVNVTVHMSAKHFSVFVDWALKRLIVLYLFIVLYCIVLTSVNAFTVPEWPLRYCI